MDEESKERRRSAWRGVRISRGGATISQTFRWSNLALAFLLELCALAALAYWGFAAGDGAILKVGLGVGAPLLAAVLWGLFAAPRAPVSAPLARAATQMAVFGSAAVALYATDHHVLAVAFVLLVVANGVLVRL